MNTKEPGKSFMQNENLIEALFGDFGFTRTPPSYFEEISLDVGYALIPLVDTEQGGTLLEKIKSVRHRVNAELGFTFPLVHVQDDMLLKSGEYSIHIRDNEVALVELWEGHCLAIAPDPVVEEIDGIPTKDPIYGLNAIWIAENIRDEVRSKGYTVFDFTTIISTHLYEIVKRHAHEIIGQHEVQNMLDTLKESYPKVVEKLIPDLLPFEAVVAVIKKLLKEQVPVRNLAVILEALAERALVTKDLDELTKYVRQIDRS